VVILYGGQVRAQGSLNELLTVSDSTRIVTPTLPPETTEKMLSILREKLKDDEFVIDHPRRSLEEFFLEVIARAKSESVETSGALGGGIAEYLSAEKDEKSAVLEQLIAEPEVKKTRQSEEEKAAALAEELKAAEEKLLADLTADKKEDVVSKDEEAAQAEAEALAAANAKLDDILNKR
jgi:ABC-2 type transport system ATP-binding protein